MHQIDAARSLQGQLEGMDRWQKFYIIPGGDFTGYVVCLWCCTVLKNNLAYHNCLLYTDIYEWNIRATSSLRHCPFTNCPCKNDCILDSLNHNYHIHNTVIIYTCDKCGIGFVSKIGVYLHRQHTNYQCDSQSCE